MTFWKRRSKAPSFSIFWRYSSSVVAPMHWISPLANAGFNMLAASIEPAAEPAPTMVCISSMKRIILGFFFNSFKIERIRSSNCPRYFVPATTAVISSAITRLSNKMRETFFSTIRSASPSTIADLPTPGSPMRIGLFFLRRLRIWANRSISLIRPTTGSNLPSSAARVISVPKLSSTGVSLVGFFWVERVCWVAPDWLFPVEGWFWISSSSSSSSSLNPSPAWISGWRVSCSIILSYVTLLLSSKWKAELFLTFMIANRICSESASEFLSNFASKIQSFNTLDADSLKLILAS